MTSSLSTLLIQSCIDEGVYVVFSSLYNVCMQV